MQEWIVPAVLGALALLALVLVVALVVGRSRTSRELARAHAETASLRAQMDDLERRVAEGARAPRRAAPDDTDYVITAVGQDLRLPRHAADEPPARIEGALFADLVLRETVVRAASLAHGVRTALAPEARNRIRFEVRREVKRARKQRRSDLKVARRDWEARQRADLDVPAGTAT
ncbi:hypothetical protein H5V45_19415 [Nocardioides sp. KIGAM211]|uniref:Uncharacterized protein n=1 Tax=Nocardioides luti TaxID=2761101 RepID=A0A7X0VDM8_9ACTN|nr:hypothetical protein [Nocardioides luti]MBB6629503.1 hypothetical protein [Nocardioides luti]